MVRPHAIANLRKHPSGQHFNEDISLLEGNFSGAGERANTLTVAIAFCTAFLELVGGILSGFAACRSPGGTDSAPRSSLPSPSSPPAPTPASS
eukprot:8978512-Pyramimonas_sp.AAC.1